MFGVTADNELGCDSSELHIPYLSNFLLRNSGTHCKIAPGNQKQQSSKIVPGNDVFVMSDSLGRSGMSTDKSPPPPQLWWSMVINSAPSVTPNVFLLEFRTKSTSRQDLTIFQSISCIFCIFPARYCHPSLLLVSKMQSGIITLTVSFNLKAISSCRNLAALDSPWKLLKSPAEK